MAIYWMLCQYATFVCILNIVKLCLSIFLLSHLFNSLLALFQEMCWMVTGRNVLWHTISHWLRFITHTHAHAPPFSIHRPLSSEQSFLLSTLSSLTVSPSPPFSLFPPYRLFLTPSIFTLIWASYQGPNTDRSNWSSVSSCTACHGRMDLWHTQPHRKKRLIAYLMLWAALVFSVFTRAAPPPFLIQVRGQRISQTEEIIHGAQACSLLL